MNIVNNDPEIIFYDNFITDEECHFIINVSKDNMKRAGVSNNSIDLDKYKGRTNKSYWIPLDKYDIMKRLCIRIAIEIGVPFKHFEAFQVIHYSINQEYKYHYDAYNKNDIEKYKKYCSKRGNRLKTVLCYLNDVKEGGGTGFNNIEGRTDPLIIEPVKGRMVVFQNTNKDGTLNVQSRHAGLPVISGEKWAFNLWIREK